jgi:glycosyltransferase involved in cell wall biosynthesis
MTTPFVSVLIDTFNHERFIEEALQSVLAQDFPAADREILVVDDGSTDRTPEILAKFASEIRILRTTNGGQASAFNHGIPQCRGEVIAFLDGDDWWAPDKLRRIAGLFANDASLGVVGHGIIESLSDGSEQILAPASVSRFRLDSVSSAEHFRQNRCYLGTSRLSLRSEVARKILPVPESLVFEADEYLFTLAPVIADTTILPDPLTYYRLHSANLFMTTADSSSGERRKQKVLADLAVELRRALPLYGASADVARVVLELVEAEAAQLRLKFNGGYPWETYRTETAVYRIQHPGASHRSKAFRLVSMIPALFLPPRWFYSGRQWLGSQTWYRRARATAIPSPAQTPSIPQAKASMREDPQSNSQR